MGFLQALKAKNKQRRSRKKDDRRATNRKILLDMTISVIIVIISVISQAIKSKYYD
jgi:hypothetical protein